MNPTEYERYVASVYEKEGYTTTVTPTSGDGGIDVYAVKNDEKIGIQCKLYGGTSRSVNAKDIRQLYGAAAENDCTNSVIATDGDLLYDAIGTAKKLGVDIRYISPYGESGKKTKSGLSALEEVLSETRKFFKNQDHREADLSTCPEIKDPMELLNKIPSFGDMWDKHIKPLKDAKVYLGNGTDCNVIKDVDYSGLTRISKNNKKSKVPIEAFRYAYNTLLQEGEVYRDDINQEYHKLCSSIVVHVLATLPFVEKIGKAEGLKIRQDF